MKLPITCLSGSGREPRSTRPQRRTGRAGTGLVLLLGAAVALSACGSSDPADAATVNGEVISTHEVQAVTHEVNTEVRSQQPVAPTDILAILIEGKFALQQQAAAGKAVSADDARKIVADQLKWANPSPEAVEFFRNVVAVEAARQDPAASKDISTQLADATIRVNPRYGTDFNLKTRQMADLDPDWIKPVQVPGAPQPSGTSEPVPEPSPTPSN